MGEFISPTALSRSPTDFSDLKRLSEYADEAPPTWLVNGIVPSQGLGVVHGAPGVGKTFLTLSLSFAITHGLDWCGQPTEKGCVVYVAGEGRKGVIQRAKAWHEYQGLDLDDADVFLLPRPVDIFNPESVRTLIAEIRKLANGKRIGMSVIDTLSRCFGGRDENGQGDMSRFVEACDTIARELDCFVLICHHEAKGNGTIRGSTTLPGAVDFQLGLTKTTTGFDAEVIKQKDGEDGAIYRFALERVDMGLNQHGQPVSSCVALLDGTSTAKAKPPEALGKNQAGLLTLLNIAGPTGFSDEEWGFNAKAAEVLSGQKPVRAYRDARDALVKAGHVLLEGGRYRIPMAAE